MTLLGYDNEKVFIADIYKTFSKKYWPSSLDTSLKKRGKFKEEASLILYKKVVKNYMKIYFNELYFGRLKEMYFFLGGKMTLTLATPKIMNVDRTKMSGYSINLLWFMRPHASIWKCVKVKKLTGISNIMINLDEKYKAKNDLLLLPSVRKTIGLFSKEKKLFRI